MNNQQFPVFSCTHTMKSFLLSHVDLEATVGRLSQIREALFSHSSFPPHPFPPSRPSITYILLTTIPISTQVPEICIIILFTSYNQHLDGANSKEQHKTSSSRTWRLQVILVQLLRHNKHPLSLVVSENLSQENK